MVARENSGKRGIIDTEYRLIQDEGTEFFGEETSDRAVASEIDQNLHDL